MKTLSRFARSGELVRRAHGLVSARAMYHRARPAVERVPFSREYRCSLSRFVHTPALVKHAANPENRHVCAALCRRATTVVCTYHTLQVPVLFLISGVQEARQLACTVSSTAVGINSTTTTVPCCCTKCVSSSTKRERERLSRTRASGSASIQWRRDGRLF